MTVVISQCFSCKHYKGILKEETPICDAFKDGIPTNVFNNTQLHNVPIVGDNGIQYEEKSNTSKSVSNIF